MRTAWDNLSVALALLALAVVFLIADLLGSALLAVSISVFAVAFVFACAATLRLVKQTIAEAHPPRDRV
jgi:hypothetical protein